MIKATENTVSIITPTYQRDDLLRETVASVLKQTYPNWQLLIIDDALSTATEEVVQSYHDERIVYLRRPEHKKGAPACRNVGIANSSGKYLMFLDSDDLLSPLCLANRVKAFESHPQLDFLAFNTAFFHNEIEDARVLWNRFDDCNDLERFISGDVVWHTSGSFFKTASLVENGIIYNEKALSGQDLFFHLDVLLKNLSYEKIDSVPDVFIRRNPSQSRISDEHADRDKVYNRIHLMKEMLSQPQINNKDSYMNLWIATIFREYIQFINSGRAVKKSILSFDQQYLKSKELKRTYSKIKLANFFNSVQPILYRAIRKLLPGLAANITTANSLYRSPMTTEEIKQFERLMSHQPGEKEAWRVK